MTTPIPPTPIPTPVPEGLATEVRNLGEQVDELSNHPCVEFDEYINPSTNELELGYEDEDTPCSQNDPRFAGGDWQRRKRCLQCFVQNEYGVTINAQSDEFSAEEVRILVRALIQVRNILNDRIRIECSDITVPPDVFQRLFGDEIIFELIADRPSSSETTENGVIIRLADDDIMSLGNPESSAIELAG
ncbi:MAG: hypothetical protein ACFE0Q_14445, partial [Anaerolineae bacterium]